MSIEAWKHHLSIHFEKDPSLLVNNGAGEGGLIYLDWDTMIYDLTISEHRWHVAKLWVEDDEIELIDEYTARMLIYKKSPYGFCPIHRDIQSKTVEKAAIMSSIDASIHDVPRPGRHHDVMRIMKSKGYPLPISGCQGFTLNDGSFCCRHEAARIALANRQVKNLTIASQLISEDLW